MLNARKLLDPAIGQAVSPAGHRPSTAGERFLRALADPERMQDSPEAVKPVLQLILHDVTELTVEQRATPFVGATLMAKDQILLAIAREPTHHLVPYDPQLLMSLVTEMLQRMLSVWPSSKRVPLDIPGVRHGVEIVAIITSDSARAL